MGVKSVVDIEINDEKFKRYNELFTRYQEALKSTPKHWKAVGEATDSAASSFEKILAAQMAQKDLERIMADEAEHSGKELQTQSRLWSSIQKSTTGVLKNVMSIAKWLTVGFGLGGIGLSVLTPLGLRAAAEAIAGERNQALGLNLKIGEQRAFGLTVGRYFDDQGQSLLQGAFQGRSNLQSPAFATMAALGISPNQSTVGVADQLLLTLQARAKAMPQQQLGNLLSMFPGLSQFGISLETLQQLRALSTGELKGQISAFGPTAQGLGLTDKQGKQYQDFLSSIDTTWGTMVRQLERDLVPLLGPMQKLLRAIGQDIGILLKSGAAQKAIDGLASALDRFTTYVGSKEFQQDIDSFLNNVDRINRVFHPVSTLVQNVPGIPAALSAWEAGVKWDRTGEASAKKFGIPSAFLQGQAMSGMMGNNPALIAEEDRRILNELKAAGVPTRDQFAQLSQILSLKQTAGFDEKRYIGGLPHASPIPTVKVTVQNNTGGNANVSVAAMGGGIN